MATNAQIEDLKSINSEMQKYLALRTNMADFRITALSNLSKTENIAIQLGSE